MVRPVKRRQASVRRVQQLIEGISYIRYQRQISNVERLTRYMDREHGVKKSETEKHLHYAVLDNLILSYTGVGFKGTKTGVEYEGFRIPDPEEAEVDDDGHDWYCFECHLPGDVYMCSDCWRVFHRDCQKEEVSGDKYLCSVCKAGRKQKKTKRKLLNTLLSYTILRLKEKTRELHRLGHRAEEKKTMPMFVYKPMDLNKMEQKVMAHKYKSVEEFLADAHLILHNVVLMYGDEAVGGMTELARIMIRDCKYDVEEMNQCHNCYYMSNAKPKNWFCQPCDPSHELVYAKLKGYSYWPAKVIRYLDNDKYDVRFFGGLHQRACIPKDQTKPVDISAKKLNAKRTAGFLKAEEELKLHRKLLREKKEEEEEEDEEFEEEEEEDTTQGKDEEEEEEEEEEENGVREEKEVANIEVTSTSVISTKRSSRKVASPEDANIVTSSEEYVPPTKQARLSTASTGSQTSSRKYGSAAATASTTTTKSSSTQTDSDNSVQCDCELKYNKICADLKDRLEREHKDGKKKALDELSSRLRKDFEEDKQQAVSRAMSQLQQELERVRRQTEDKCKEQYKEEMKKLAQKHKDTNSQIKKKQWCYNCEEEAMYHCCWNTSYCSTTCQQEHWHKEHKRVCRRKR